MISAVFRFLVVRAVLGKYIEGCLEKGIQTPVAQGRSTTTISMIE